MIYIVAYRHCQIKKCSNEEVIIDCIYFELDKKSILFPSVYVCCDNS